MKASHRQHKIKVGFQEITLEPGQFIFGRRQAAENLNMTEWQIRSCLNFLKKAGNLTIKTTNRFSIITIVNWSVYQSYESENRQQIHQQTASKPPQTIMEEGKQTPIQEVFSYWQQVMNHPRSKLTDDRKKKVKARLMEGYTVEDIKKAINGCKASPHHMGQNEHQTIYDDLELICRKGSKLEFFMQKAERKPGPKYL
jgi:uncharacterized phage protein (TIGR02220 family)